MNSKNSIDSLFTESISVKEACINQGFDSLVSMGNEICNSILDRGKIMLCGNGGSAADAQHLAAEMLVRLRPMNNREALPAIALAQDTSTITACGNDFGFEKLYERMVNALGKKGDCLIALTTSGNSQNIILAMKVAKSLDMKVFGFLGCGGGQALELCDEFFLVPSNSTGRIQESHITAGHALMEFVEDKLIEIGYLNIQSRI
jgi:D-sedoheptulose 7-phosphate isomerase